MRLIGKFLEDKKIVSQKHIDQESIFFIFRGVIKIKYGEVGSLNIKPDYYKEGVVYVRIGNSNWANELWLNKDMLVEEINKKIGEKEILDIKIK